MNYSVIKNEITNMNIKPVYLLYGEDDYLKQSIYSVLKSAAEKKSSKTFDEYLYDENLDLSEVVQQLETFSFTGNPKILKLTNTGCFTKSDNIHYLEQLLRPSDYDMVVFIETKINKNTKAYKQYSKAKATYDISTGTDSDVKRYIQAQFKRAGKSVSIEDLTLFIEYSGLNLSFVSMSIEKIILYSGDRNVITKEDIQLLATGITDVKAYELCNALVEKNLKKSLVLYNDLSALKYTMPYFSAVLFNTFYEYYNIKKHSIKHANDFRTRKAILAADKYSLNKLKSILNTIVDNDHLFKTGRIDQETAIIIIFTNIVE